MILFILQLLYLIITFAILNNMANTCNTDNTSSCLTFSHENTCDISCEDFKSNISKILTIISSCASPSERVDKIAELYKYNIKYCACLSKPGMFGLVCTLYQKILELEGSVYNYVADGFVSLNQARNMVLSGVKLLTIIKALYNEDLIVDRINNMNPPGQLVYNTDDLEDHEDPDDLNNRRTKF